MDGLDGTAGPAVVDAVDGSAYVAGELDRRHPERLPEAVRQERVDGERSVVETSATSCSPSTPG